MTSPDDEFALLDDRLDLDADNLDPDHRDLEAPAEDVAEQATPVNPASARYAPTTTFEVGEYDAMEQSRVVDLDDEY